VNWSKFHLALKAFHKVTLSFIVAIIIAQVTFAVFFPLFLALSILGMPGDASLLTLL